MAVRRLPGTLEAIEKGPPAPMEPSFIHVFRSGAARGGNANFHPCLLQVYRRQRGSTSI